MDDLLENLRSFHSNTRKLNLGKLWGDTSFDISIFAANSTLFDR